MELIGLLFFLSCLWGVGQIAYVAAFVGGALLFGTLGFWTMTAIATILLFVFIDNDAGTAATGTLLSFLLLLHLYGGVPIFSYLYQHPMQSGLFLLGYFGAGTLWSVAKWWFYVHDRRTEYDEAFSQWEKSTVRGKSSWASVAPEKPSATDSKDRILRWMTFWPWSMMWTLLNDPIKKLFKAIYKRLSGLFQKIADRAYEGAP